ncbi:MAG: hypothetical protein QM736_19680 [Vicinamibacterales bacterium]
MLGIACESKSHDPSNEAVTAVSKCERIALPGRLGPPDPLETLRVMQGFASREQFVKNTLAPVVKSEASNPELQRRAALAVGAYCERHGVAVPVEVRKCLSAPAATTRASQPERVQTLAQPTVVKRSTSASDAAALREQSAQIANLKKRIADLQRRKR